MISVQNMYSDFVSNVTSAFLSRQIPAGSSFFKVRNSSGEYWCAKLPDGRTKYCGRAEDSSVEDMLRRERDIKKLDGECRALARALKANGASDPGPAMSGVLNVLAEAGAFRLRCVLVGTLAFQIYIPMLGMSLPASAMRTSVIDIAQSKSVSVFVGEKLEENFESLLMRKGRFERKYDPHSGEPPCSWIDLSTGISVDLLAPLSQKWDEYAVELPALGARAEKLKFIDFLIRDEIRAAVVHGAGIPVNVPQPARYAVHKLIIANDRRNAEKKVKDRRQAEILTRWFLENDRETFLATLEEARERGPGWRKRIASSLEALKLEPA